MSKLITYILLILTSAVFGQNMNPNLFVDEFNFDFFKANNFRKIIVTGYSKSDTETEFKRGDKVLYLFHDTLIEYNWLKKNNRPLKSITAYYKQDSLGHLYYWHKKYGSNNNKYIVKNSLITRDNAYEYHYDTNNRVIKQKTVDTAWSGAIVYSGSISEFKYFGDTLVEEYSFRYNAKPENKYGETITKTFYRNKIKNLGFIDEYDYSINKYIRIATITYQVAQTETGFKTVTTYSYKKGIVIFITEFINEN